MTPPYLRRRSDSDTPAQFFIKAFCFLILGLMLAVGLFGCNAKPLTTQPQSVAVVSSTEIPRAPVVVRTPVPRPTPRVVPPRGLHTRRSSGGWIFLEPNE